MSVVSFTAARQIVEEHARRLTPAGTEAVSLLDACRRVLAGEVVADRNFPPFARATRDGYAIHTADLQSLPARLTITGEIKAGASLQQDSVVLQRGEAMEIMTGAPAPPGADAVLMVEHTARQGRILTVGQAVAPGENIVPQGAEAHAGDCLLAPGMCLTPAAIGLAASCGYAELEVYRRPRVAILSTGDELVDITAHPGPSQIRNSNSYSLAAQVAEAGGTPVMLPIARDEAGSLREAITRGLEDDLLLLTGGVSMGKYDLVEPVLAELRAEFLFTGARIQPGRPVVFGRTAGRFFFGLPGNPVATLVVFALFVRPVIAALSGQPLQPLMFPQARLKSELRTKTGLTRFLPAVLSGEFERAEVEPVRWQGSGDLAAAARANCYLVVPPDRESIPAGELVGVLLG